jgi:hypothetical protein
LLDDVVLVLRSNKMRVIDRVVTPKGGYRVNYSGGGTEGTITLEPVVADGTIHRRMPLPSGNQDVKAEIRIEEKWVKKQTTPAGGPFNPSVGLIGAVFGDIRR